ncbi:MAG: bifunctional [glutamate--ammonia ligase]-adenylyl-L-tyrosine phosphorylase/[glutamate--ammonia-ligase] adenylyltransferase [Burkholderiales bacterium]|nr:bifunctional [glutamate--ammonia ligase]-adenylyl-L-tyrosine phosphorylase/[glutamate--ammonia-ligase] adenylyltransferase [Burkholderiales bacterium]MDP2398418.1 bifunctional [glutamate--ammonia ligase]-adenylyl-L-tyrosine phosphorylase/[glutamate--ammonia-ligase] adenylyltransferase [Burkholderiales bacterium]
MISANSTRERDAGDPITRAARYSRYLQRLLAASPNVISTPELAHAFTAADMQAELDHGGIGDDRSLGRALRRLRQRTLARLIARDLGGLADLREVVATVTTLAEVVIRKAVTQLHLDLAAVHGEPRGATDGKAQQLHVVGMGKLGGAELNASSDIDLVLVYPEEGETDGGRPLSNHEFFTRLARRLIGALSEWTEDGFVFRVDTRLRPYGDSGPLVVSFDMLENYLITQGRAWERYAWIKGRPLTGDQQDALLALVRPFVYRRHLDYGAFASMRSLHSQVRHEVNRRDRQDNIKLGPGGIREIEFIAQVFQLIRGGHEHALQQQSTLPVLAVLGERGFIAPDAVSELSAAYVFLRNLEHRLQYRDDQQTQDLPWQDEERALLAESMGFPCTDAFLAELSRHRDAVSRHFEAIFAESDAGDEHPLAALWQEQPENGEADDAAAEQLAGLGFARGGELSRQLALFRNGSRYRQMPAASQRRLDRLVPAAIAAAASRRNPDDTAGRLLALFESISRREAYLALLHEYPHALDRVADLMSASPWVAQYITRHPILIDELLDARTLLAAPDWKVLKATLHEGLDSAQGDIERQMDLLRHFKNTHTLHFIAQDLAGELPLETLSDHLSDLACVILDAVLRLSWLGLRQRHRDEPLFAIVGYGKLGGKELGYASDLDIVFVYDDPAPEAAENYARLAQRINYWLTSTTTAGVLYETDLRLRPDGAGGLLVTPLDSLRRYQLEQAWLWEHQALTRARSVTGDPGISRDFEDLRISVLRKQREDGALREGIIEMRRKMLEAHPNASGLFDLKHDPGGIIDVEFMVQYLVLGHAHEHPGLSANAGNLALLKAAGGLGLIGEDEAEAVRSAYRQFRKLQHQLRLAGERYARVEPVTVTVAAAAVRALWSKLFGNAGRLPGQDRD